MLFTTLNLHKLNMYFHLGNLGRSGTRMIFGPYPAISLHLTFLHTQFLHLSISCFKDFSSSQTRTLETLTLNKSLILKNNFKIQLCYQQLGDTELPPNLAGPQLLYLQKESVVKCDFSGTVQLYHFACHMPSLRYFSYLWLSMPTIFCKNFILLKEYILQRSN